MIHVCDSGLSDYTATLTIAVLFNIILTLQMVEIYIYIFWDGILTVKDNGMVGILTDKPFLHQNSLAQPVGDIDTCINSDGIGAI